MFSLSELAQRLGLEVQGPCDTTILGLCSLEEPQTGCLSFAENPRQLKSARGLAAVIAAPGSDTEFPVLLSPKPRLAFARALALFYPETPARPGIHPTAQVSPRAQVSSLAEVGPYCIIEAGATIAEGTRLVARVLVGADSEIGPDCRVHPGVGIGRRVSVGANCVLEPHCRLMDNTVIESLVHVGARCVLHGCTIGTGTKLDNICYIGEGTRVGPHSIHVSKSYLGKRVKTGPYFLIAAISVIADDVSLGPLTQVAGHSWVDRSWDEPRLQLAGEPARLLKQEVRERALRLRAAKIYKERH